MSRSTVERTGEAHGLEYVVLAIDMGHRCGYVRVPDDHPWCGLDYSGEVPAPTAPPDDATIDDYGMAGMIGALSGSADFLKCVEGQLRVHGGVTYAGEQPNPNCEKGWWFGFDCAHLGDARDPSIMSPRYSSFMRDAPGVVRTTEFVVAECERLAEQLAAVRVRTSS